MKSKHTARLVRYGIPFLIGMAISLLVARHQGFALVQPAYLQARYLSDGFFVAGILLSGLGGLLVISNTGFFDMFSYAMYCLMIRFAQVKRKGDHVSFYAYKVSKDARRGKSKSFLLLTGLGFCLLSAGCWALYSLH
ncbi:hypothetical protein SDC9_193337 [bioreactor metagenome]|uniref:DUF3899 domain-containing protein n=1 Tax=bioreactor metagenome TaxID=1076179 RepID=A0A645I4H0_9ZZZZ